jgi:hypothetical protein
VYDEGVEVCGDGDQDGVVERVFVPDEAEGPLDLSLLERRILSLRPDAKADAAAALMAQVNAVVELAQRLKWLTWEQVFGWVRANGPLQVGQSRYYIGDKTVTECTDVAKAVDLILEACGGDLGQFCKCLASRPLKHGWCRGVLKARWGEVFRVRVANELKEDGTPRQYLKVDNGFGMGRRGGAAGD